VLCRMARGSMSVSSLRPRTAPQEGRICTEAAFQQAWVGDGLIIPVIVRVGKIAVQQHQVADRAIGLQQSGAVHLMQRGGT
jgi:hypothetical protein